MPLGCPSLHGGAPACTGEPPLARGSPLAQAAPSPTRPLPPPHPPHRRMRISTVFHRFCPENPGKSGIFPEIRGLPRENPGKSRGIRGKSREFRENPGKSGKIQENPGKSGEIQDAATGGEEAAACRHHQGVGGGVVATTTNARGSQGGRVDLVRAAMSPPGTQLFRSQNNKNGPEQRLFATTYALVIFCLRFFACLLLRFYALAIFDFSIFLVL